MAKKITTQNLVDTLRQRGWNAQQVEPFVDAFFKSLNDGITRDGIVKVKGLGTFKTIKVADPGSVDVNTGERIVIPGHNKLKFVEEDKVNAVLNGAERVEPTPAPKKVAARKVETPAIDNASPSISPLLEEGAREASSPSTHSSLPLRGGRGERLRGAGRVLLYHHLFAIHDVDTFLNAICLLTSYIINALHCLLCRDSIDCCWSTNSHGRLNFVCRI